jgi:glycosyltransferase involved in cell wall biosynthesis
MKKPSVILFDANPLNGNKTGVGYYTQGLISSLAINYSDEVKIVGYYFGNHAPSAPTANNISYRKVGLFPQKVVNLLRRLNLAIPIEILTRTRPDFILYPAFLDMPSLFHVPSATVIHDLAFLDHPAFLSTRNANDLNKLVPKTLKRSKLTITVSQFTKRRLIESYGINKEKIITTFIPPAKPLLVSNPQRKEILNNLKITKPFILFIGTLEPRKNLINLLNAYAFLAPDLREEYSLVIVGQVGWKSEPIIKRLKQLQTEGYDIKHLGYVDDKTRAALYLSAKLFVLPSLYEGFGMPILEALSYGVPCAVSDIPPFRELANKFVKYFNPKEPKKISYVLAQELSVQKKLPSNNLSSYLQGNPSWDDISKLVYESMRNYI